MPLFERFHDDPDIICVGDWIKTFKNEIAFILRIHNK